jgi:hypothetical protein
MNCIRILLRTYSDFWTQHSMCSESIRQSKVDKLEYLDHHLAVLIPQERHLNIKAFYIAARLYRFQNFMVLPHGVPTMTCQARLLKEALPSSTQMKVEDGDGDVICQQSHSSDVEPPSEENLRLWKLFVGGVSAAGSPEGKWYVEQVSKMCIRLGLYQWEDAKAALQTVAWFEKSCEEPWRELWGEGQRYHWQESPRSVTCS